MHAEAERRTRQLLDDVQAAMTYDGMTHSETDNDTEHGTIPEAVKSEREEDDENTRAVLAMDTSGLRSKGNDIRSIIGTED